MIIYNEKIAAKRKVLQIIPFRQTETADLVQTYLFAVRVQKMAFPA